jgi:hypothetical protein
MALIGNTPGQHGDHQTRSQTDEERAHFVREYRRASQKSRLGRVLRIKAHAPRAALELVAAGQHDRISAHHDSIAANRAFDATGARPQKGSRA